MPAPYRTLFLLEASSAFIFEIKRLAVQSTNPSEVYFWLRFDKASRQLLPLTFVSMHAEGEVQQRDFAQGRLQFGPGQGTFAPHDEELPLALHLVTPAILPAEVDAAVQAYFQTT